MSTQAAMTQYAMSDEEILKYVPLAKKLSRNYFFGSKEEPEEIAILSLVRAARAFDPKRNVPFGVFAKVVISRDLSAAIAQNYVNDRVVSIEMYVSPDFENNGGRDSGIPKKIQRALSSGEWWETIDEKSDGVDSFQVFLDSLTDEEYTLVELKFHHTNLETILEIMQFSQPTLSRRMKCIRQKFHSAFHPNR